MNKIMRSLRFLFFPLFLGISLWIEFWNEDETVFVHKDVAELKIVHPQFQIPDSNRTCSTVSASTIEYNRTSQKVYLDDLRMLSHQEDSEALILSTIDCIDELIRLTNDESDNQNHLDRIQRNQRDDIMKPGLHVSKLSLKSLQMHLFVQNLRIENGVFFMFRTALYKQVEGFDLLLDLFSDNSIKHIAAKVISWKYPTSYILLEEGDIEYRNCTRESFEKCIVNLQSQLIQKIDRKKPADDSMNNRSFFGIGCNLFTHD